MPIDSLLIRDAQMGQQMLCGSVPVGRGRAVEMRRGAAGGGSLEPQGTPAATLVPGGDVCRESQSNYKMIKFKLKRNLRLPIKTNT